MHAHRKYSHRNAMFDFSTWTGKNGTEYQLNVEAGVVTSTQPDGGIY